MLVLDFYFFWFEGKYGMVEVKPTFDFDGGRSFVGGGRGVLCDRCVLVTLSDLRRSS